MLDNFELPLYVMLPVVFSLEEEIRCDRLLSTDVFPLPELPMIAVKLPLGIYASTFLRMGLISPPVGAFFRLKAVAHGGQGLSSQ